jgi:hypothetical protein
LQNKEENENENKEKKGEKKKRKKQLGECWKALEQKRRRGEGKV